MAASFLRLLYHTQQRITVGRTPLDEWSARHRDLYLKKHNTHNRQTSMPPAGFEPMISAGEWPQAYALDRAATANGSIWRGNKQYFIVLKTVSKIVKCSQCYIRNVRNFSSSKRCFQFAFLRHPCSNPRHGTPPSVWSSCSLSLDQACSKFMKCRKLRRNDICMWATWNSVHKMKNVQQYALLHVVF